MESSISTDPSSANDIMSPQQQQLVGIPLTPPPPPPPRELFSDSEVRQYPSDPLPSPLPLPLDQHQQQQQQQTDSIPQTTLPSSPMLPPLIQRGQHPHFNLHVSTYPGTAEGYQLDESPEVFDDELSNKSGGTSWTKRIPWMRRKSHMYNNNNNNMSPSNEFEVRSALSADSYLSKPSVSYAPSSLPTSISNDPPKQTSHHRFTIGGTGGGSGIIARTLSRMSRTAATSHKNVGDFSESDWTPPDSAYGAACPICGCLPKNVRRAIEMTLIGAVTLVLIYLVVTTSIRIGNDHHHNGNGRNSSTSSSQDDDARIKLDDDYYIEYNKRNDDASTSAAATNDDDAASAAASSNDDAASSSNDDTYGNRAARHGRILFVEAPPWSLVELLLPQDLI